MAQSAEYVSCFRDNPLRVTPAELRLFLFILNQIGLVLKQQTRIVCTCTIVR